MTDLEISNSIRNAFERNPYLSRLNINVRVFDGGTAYLAGRVETMFEKNQAEETAARIKGVTKVINRLRVNEQWPQKADAEIREDVQNQLWWSPFVDSDKISVSIDDGLVTLQGTVETWQERKIVAKDAYEGGAQSVRNEVTVENNAEEDMDS